MSSSVGGARRFVDGAHRMGRVRTGRGRGRESSVGVRRRVRRPPWRARQIRSEREIRMIEPEGKGVNTTEEALNYAKLDHPTHVDGHSVEGVELDPSRKSERRFEA